ncbi:hypothetical protein Q428_02680 [Fervidicella metallireducens AeB]|uniref:Spore germination protein n=1 Tax=Fervidicella metallireducens AeB TaxID=1403537 RepID=A0A017RY67_9CLOT|nr:hypothetical protein Q428_02680 [Fervidicella metallireducens AeB]
MIYISGIADKKEIQEIILKPLLNLPIPNKDIDLIDEVCKRYIYASDITTTNSIKTICSEVLNGKCAILIDGSDKAILCDVKSSNYRAIQESTTEKSILGSKEAFVENIEINITMIQRKIKNPNLKTENFIIGTETNTQIAITYIDGIIDPKVLDKIKTKLLNISVPIINSSGFIEQLLDTRWYNIFPIAKTTEKPDKVALDLVKGKAAILIAEYPGALVVPGTFLEFFQGAEDYSDKVVIASFSRLLRLIAIITIIILEPIYLALLYYNPELFPYELISIIISSRQNIPLPPLLEIFAMDLAVEILREGGIRLPTPIGTTLAIVGGIVIGESATKAGLVSNITLFIVAMTVISTFLIPNYQMTLSIRFIRFPLLLLAQLFGFLGILSGLYFFILILTKMDNFGVEYFSPFMPMRLSDIYDTIIRGPLNKVLKPPKSLQGSNRTKN